MKNVILLKNRGFDQYDFKELKEKYGLNLSIITFKKALENLSQEVLQSFPKVYTLNDINSEFDSPLPKDQINSTLEKLNLENSWIVAADELNVLTAASLREKYNLLGSSSLLIFNYRNKAQQLRLIKSAAMRTPRFISLQKPLKVNRMKKVYESVAQNLKLPFILKPVDMGGTTGVEKIESYQNFLNYFSKFANFSDLIAEEFIEGQLYHWDFIIHDNRYIFSEVSEYLYNGLSFLQGCNHGSLLLNPTNPSRLPIIEFCKKANSILGIRSGCGHFEVFVTKQGEIIFLEAAARPAGSMVPLVFNKMFEQNYLNAALLAEIGIDPGFFSPPKKYYFWAYFPKKQGVIKKLNYPSLKSSYNLKWLVNVNDALKRPASISEKAGFLLARNKEYEILRSDFYSLRHFEAVETQ